MIFSANSKLLKIAALTVGIAWPGLAGAQICASGEACKDIRVQKYPNECLYWLNTGSRTINLTTTATFVSMGLVYPGQTLDLMYGYPPNQCIKSGQTPFTATYQ